METFISSLGLVLGVPGSGFGVEGSGCGVLV